MAGESVSGLNRENCQKNFHSIYQVRTEMQYLIQVTIDCYYDSQIRDRH